MIPCASEKEARFITPDVDVGETIECTPDLVEDILEAEEERPVGALRIAILEEDDLEIFAEEQYAMSLVRCAGADGGGSAGLSGPGLLRRHRRTGAGGAGTTFQTLWAHRTLKSSL